MENNIKTILVPIDGSQTSFRALDTAIEVSRVCHSRILGIHSIPFLPSGFMTSVVPYNIYQKKEAGKFLEVAKTRSARKGILFSYAITFGNPVEEILNIVKKKRIDLIVIGARGKNRVSDFFLGSVSNAVLHKSKIPVLLVK